MREMYHRRLDIQINQIHHSNQLSNDLRDLITRLQQVNMLNLGRQERVEMLFIVQHLQRIVDQERREIDSALEEEIGDQFLDNEIFVNRLRGFRPQYSHRLEEALEEAIG